eukprot:TRINITY_DN88797_c0_g1_i1.p1 TRINITY_DN88797_c0_g1~~TRINITY_DN88797_c0_g1_i1.p1  ORF type:complete len:478 (-),score=66.70 TRINITY_DN88797_c0_g1_i1:342-1706(-)
MGSNSLADGRVEAPSRMIVYSHSWLPAQVDGVAVRMMAHVQELVDRGTKVTVVTPDFNADGGGPKELGPMKGVEHRTLETIWTPVYRKNMCMAYSLRNLSDLVTLIKKMKPDCVHATQEASLQILAFACLICDVPLVVSMHTDVSQIAVRDAAFSSAFGAGVIGRIHSYAAARCANWGYRNWSHTGAYYLAVSNHAKKCLRDAGVRDSKVAPECWGPMVDRSIFTLDLPKDRVAAAREDLSFGLKDVFVMSYVGRVTAEKDIQFLVDGHRRALQRAKNGGGRQTVLVLIGPGSMIPELKKLHGKEHLIHCTGEFVQRDELAIKLRACDCCVSASTMETVGFTAMEALSCGVPFLAARAQGFAEHLSHGVNARLWTPHDEESFDKELAELMATPRTDNWSPEALRESIKSASVSCCTDRALRAYLFAKPANMRLLRLGFALFISMLQWSFKWVMY